LQEQRNLGSNGIYTNFELPFSRGCAARCAEAAIPFLNLRDLLLGYAPLVWRRKKLSKSIHCALLLTPKA
jgi:hypothetical protein